MGKTPFTAQDAKLAREKKEREVKEFIEAMRNGDKKEQEIAKVMEWCPKTYQHQYMRSFKGELGRADSVKLNCINCAGWSLNEARKCVSNHCVMWNHRPR